MRCPHCGNRDPRTIHDNGCKPSDPDYTLLCTRRVKPEDSSFDEGSLYESDYDEQGLVQCGMQWEPNAERLEREAEQRREDEWERETKGEDTPALNPPWWENR